MRTSKSEPDEYGKRPMRAGAFAACALLAGLSVVSDAHAFKLFGLTLFGSDDETVEVINPVRYDATLDTGSADKDLAERLENTASLVNDEEQPVSGDLGIVIKAREDRDRLVA